MNPRSRLAGLVGRSTRSRAGLGRSVAAIRDRIEQARARRRLDNAKVRLAPGSMEPLVGWSHRDPNDAGRIQSPGSRRGDIHPGRDIAVLVYRGVSSAEVEMVGDALARPLAARVRLVSAEPGNVVAIEPARMIVAEPLTAVPRPYGLVIPGGLAWKREAERQELIGWLEAAVAAARGIIAVSTGSLLLAATGALDGRPAAGHWLAGDLMAELGAQPSADRVVHQRLLVTASGALAGAEAAADLAREMRFSV